MDSIIYLLKELYAYCTDFIINLSNITGLSYYEINFAIFIVLYPLLLFVAPTIFFIQKLRLRHYEKKTTSGTRPKTKSYFENIKTFNKRKIIMSANVVWLFVIVLGTLRIYSESEKYYTNHLLRGDYPPEADSISIPIFRETFIMFTILSILLIFLNLFILFTTHKANLPSKLFVFAENYNKKIVLWEFFFSFWLFINMLFLIYWMWSGYYIETLITLFFAFILLNLRAGQISKYKQTNVDNQQ